MLNIKAGLKEFMNQLIDYAGMFPPAKLDFKTAFLNYLAYQNHSDNWMMERFVFPIASYKELSEFKNEVANHASLIKLSTLPVYHASAEQFLTSFSNDVANLGKTIQSLPASFDISYFEFKLPKDLMNADENELNEFISNGIEIAKKHSNSSPKCFIEMHIDSNWEYNMNRIISVLANHTYSPFLGFKMRCGGITADAFPMAEQIATAIYLCNEFQIPIKFTAGLHHPIRRFDDSVQTNMFGFFNVFGASMLAYKFNLSIPELTAVLEVEKSEEFNFSDFGMMYNQMMISTKEIQEARNNRCMSFGSCSFDEPREDLNLLHLI